ncbi:MAG: hypothetical protein R2766_05455 [Saprospiraceae bacterium]
MKKLKNKKPKLQTGEAEVFGNKAKGKTKYVKKSKETNFKSSKCWNKYYEDDEEDGVDFRNYLEEE